MAIIRASSELRNNYNEISRLCHETNEPIFLTKNGAGDMVLMSNEAYEEMAALELRCKLLEGILDVKEGRTRPFDEAMRELDEKFGFDDIHD